jgi:hypothetical protein
MGRMPRFSLIHGHSLRALAGTCGLVFLAACGSDSGSVTDPGPDPNGGGGSGEDPSISLTLSSSGSTVEAGQSTSFTATVTRAGGFTGSVGVEVQDEPAHVEVSVSDEGGSGAASTFAVEIEVGAEAAPGAHELTVEASGTGVTAVNQAFTLTITEADDPGDNGGTGGSQVTLDFSGCRASEMPIWVGYQDGSGDWAQATGDGFVYTFQIAGGTMAYAWYAEPEGIPMTQVTFLATEEILAVQPFLICNPPRGTASMSGIVEGLGASQLAGVTLGPGFGATTGAAPEVVVGGLTEGTMDLVAFRADLSASPVPDRLLLRREVEVTDGGSLGTLDFDGSESFDPAWAIMSVSGAGGAPSNFLMGYLSGDQCLGSNGALARAQGVQTGSVELPGIPPDRQRNGDVHQLTITQAEAGSARLATQFFRVLSDRTLALPPSIDPSVSDDDGAYRRMSASFAIPSPFREGSSGMAALTLSDNDGKSFVTGVSLSRISGSTAEVTTPDLSGAPGWSDAWALPAGSSVRWTAQITASRLAGNDPANFCQEDAWARVATVEGTR